MHLGLKDFHSTYNTFSCPFFLSPSSSPPSFSPSSPPPSFSPPYFLSSRLSLVLFSALIFELLVFLHWFFFSKGIYQIHKYKKFLDKFPSGNKCIRICRKWQIALYQLRKKLSNKRLK